MGFSVSAEFLIVVLAILLTLGLVHATTSNAYDRFSDAWEESNQASRATAETSIALTDSLWDGTTLTLWVENTGERELSVTETDLFVDGTYHSLATVETAVDGDANTTVWLPGETLRVAVGTGTPRRVQVVTAHGIAAFVSPVVDTGASTGGDRVAFTSDGDLRTLVQGGPVVATYGVTDAQALGPVADGFGDDPADEVPFVDGSNRLRIADAGGETQQLTDTAQASGSRLAVGTWQGSPRSVFYASSADGDIHRVEADGTDTQITAVAADGIAGIADFDGDGSDELVWGGTDNLGTSDAVSYVDDGGSTSETGVTYGSGVGIGLGEPADFDGDGRARVPVVDGAGDVVLGAHDGTETALTSGGPAAASPLASLDWDDDGDPEVLFRGTDGDLRYVDNVTAGDDVHPVAAADGTRVGADADAGAT